MERELPIYTAEGIDFVVDVANLRLYEKGNPENEIRVSDMRDLGNRYVFDFDKDNGTYTIILPQLVQLDPVGMAEKYGFRPEEITGKTDFEVMVNQTALKERLNGRLITIDIAGHTFYVDIPMNMLRPKDDFLSTGISFSEIDHYFDDDKERYIIPYNPKTHAFQELDYDKITAIPKDLIVISFPHETILDPVGCNRKGGWDLTDGLKETNIQSHFKAQKVSWSDIGIEEVINKNRQKLQEGLKKNTSKLLPKRERRRGRGRELK